jgi:hypothetical protein
MADQHCVRPNKPPDCEPRIVPSSDAAVRTPRGLHVLPGHPRETRVVMQHFHIGVDQTVDEDSRGKVINKSDANKFGITGFCGTHFAVNCYGSILC